MVHGFPLIALLVALSSLVDSNPANGWSSSFDNPTSPLIFQEEALSAVALSALRVDRLMPVLDRTFEKWFGHFAPQVYGSWAVAGVGLLQPVAFSQATAPPGGSSPSPDARRPQVENQAAHETVADFEQRAARLAYKAMALHDRLEKAGKIVEFPFFLEQLHDLTSDVDDLIGPDPNASTKTASGHSQVLGRLIDKKSKAFREAVSRRDERTLAALNLEARVLLVERIHLQLANTDRELRRHHRTIALASLFGVAKSLWRLRLEYLWARARLFRQANLKDFLSLEGLQKLEGYLMPGAWLGHPIRRLENRHVLVDREQRIKRKQKVMVEYKTVPRFLKGQYATFQQQFTDAVNVLYQIVHLRYVQLLIEFRPGVLELKKARRDTRIVAEWAAKGTGDILQQMSLMLRDVDTTFASAIEFRQRPSLVSNQELGLSNVRRAVQSARRELQKRLPEIKNIRDHLARKIRELIAPQLQPDHRIGHFEGPARRPVEARSA